MFGHESAPSRFYSYGSREPSVNMEKVSEQMFKAHRYRNDLVEHERARRARVEEMLVKLSPQLRDVEERIAKAKQGLEGARTEIKRASAAERRKVRPAEPMKAVSEARAALKALWPERKRLRSELFSSDAWIKANEEIEVWANEEGKKLRASCGVFWGTYLHVEKSMQSARRGAPPKFKRWRGDGHLAVQCQGGLSVPDAFGCKDSRIRIEPVPSEAWKPGGRTLRRTKVWFRIGSEGPRNDIPVWVVLPIVLHRPMPEDAMIKWVHLTRDRIGTRSRWSVQFLLSRASGWARPDSAKTGTVGIDVGWRLRDDRSLRVAYWAGSDGTEGELALPADWLGEMRRVERIRSVRDKLFDAAREALALWIGETREAKLTLPDWLEEAAKTLPNWKSTSRLAALVLKWRESRFEIDRAVPRNGTLETLLREQDKENHLKLSVLGREGIFTILEAWRKRDKHLLEFEANLRDQLIHRREDIYRNFAAEMRRKYRTAIIEDLDLRDFQELPDAEEPSEDGALREHRKDACLSILRRCIVESMTEVKEAPRQNTTRLHHACGNIEDFDRKQLRHRCSHCGEEYDQDMTAARNLLARTVSA